MGERTANIISADIGETLVLLTEIIRKRHEQLPSGSYTTKLFVENPEFLYKKIIEEATEVILAAKDHDHDHIRYEAADLLYHLLVLLECEGIGIGELAGELNARMT